MLLGRIFGIIYMAATIRAAMYMVPIDWYHGQSWDTGLAKKEGFVCQKKEKYF